MTVTPTHTTDHRQWQPIDTAPKDGARVIVYCDRGARIRIMKYWQPSNPDTPGFWIDGTGSATPTHWMPLPEPPK